MESTNPHFIKFRDNINKYHEHDFAALLRVKMNGSYLNDLKAIILSECPILLESENNGYDMREICDNVESFTEEELEFILNKSPSGWPRAKLMDYWDNRYNIEDP